MKKVIAHGAVLMLMALVAACSKQDTTNITADNAFVSDETSDDNSAAFDNSLDAGLGGNFAVPADNAQ
jgi:major membrane immunogen (membrane-anchored lipoprotein)